MGMQGSSGGQNMKGQTMGQYGLGTATGNAMTQGGGGNTASDLSMKGQQSNMKGQQGMNMYGGMNGGLYSQGGQNSILWQPNMGNYTGAATSAMAGQTGQNYGQQLPSNAAGAPSAQGFQGMGQGYFGGQGPQSPWSSQSNPAGQSGGVGTGTGDMHRYASTANLFGGR